MYTLINNNIQIFSQNTSLMQHFTEYLWLQQQYANTNIIQNEVYKNRYSIFWRLNQARLSQDFKNHYFELLQNIRNHNQQTISNIIDTLYEIRINGIRKIQFSFVTKLLHTMNNNLPIYDSLIKDFFFFSKINPNLEYEDKKHRLINQYNFLTSEYQRILENDLLISSINFVRDKCQLNELVTDIKIIDSIIWSFVKYLREGGVENGNILFN